MKKKVFNQTTTPRGTRSAGNVFSIYPKSGTMKFSADLVRNLKIDTETKVNIIQDEERPKDWYIELTKESDGLQVKEKKSASGKFKEYVIQSIFLSRLILKESELPEKTIRLLVATEPVEKNMHAIITKSANTKV